MNKEKRILDDAVKKAAWILDFNANDYNRIVLDALIEKQLRMEKEETTSESKPKYETPPKDMKELAQRLKEYNSR